MCIIGTLMEKIGRRNALYLGTLTMVFATLFFGIAGYAKKADWFFFTSLVARFGQGIGEALITITTPSIVAQEFEEN